MDIPLWDMIKGIKKVVGSLSHADLKKKLIEISDTAMNLQQRNEELEQEIRELRKRQDLETRIMRSNDGYFTLKGDDQNIRYCTHCMDAKKLLIQVFKDRIPGSFFCPECSNSGIYNKQLYNENKPDQTVSFHKRNQFF